jgi:phage/plasmid-like protein (TIGR03299 family)
LNASVAFQIVGCFFGAKKMPHHIEEHDSMIAVGTRPWHGLGVTLAEPPATAEEALQLAGCSWTVSKRKMFLEDGAPVKIAGAVNRNNNGYPGAIVRDDTNEVLGVVGAGYVPMQNSQIANLYQPLIDEGIVDIDTCGSLWNGRRVWMLAKFKNSGEVIDTNDTVSRYLMLSHGHDGQMAVRFGLTYVRVVCWNTLSLAVSRGTALTKCLHTTNLIGNLETLRSFVMSNDENFALTAEVYRKLAQKTISRASLREYARQLVKAPEDQSDWNKVQADKIGQIVGMAMQGRGNSGQNWWHAYNGATEYLTWAAGRNKQTRFNNLWFGQNLSTNTEALELALSLSA